MKIIVSVLQIIAFVLILVYLVIFVRQSMEKLDGCFSQFESPIQAIIDTNNRIESIVNKNNNELKYIQDFFSPIGSH